MWNFRLGTVGTLFLAAVIGAPLATASEPPKTAYPGTLNYVEGKVSIGSQSVGANEIGSARLEPQQTLTTQQGKAELLLTPGVFLRVGDHSSVELISPNLTDTEVAVDHGRCASILSRLASSRSQSTSAILSAIRSAGRPWGRCAWRAARECSKRAGRRGPEESSRP